MKRYSEEFINAIRKIRKKEKLSFAQLGRRFNIPSSTIRNWCFNLIDVGNKWDILIHHNETERNKIRNSEVVVIPKLNSLNSRMSKFLAGLLYGCEGDKYPKSNRLGFSNSDPKLILTFLKLLKKSFKLNLEKLYVHLQVHSNQDYPKLRKTWSDLLDIPEDRFIKPTVTIPRGKKHRDNYIGTCTLRYNDYRLQLKLQGIFEAFLSRMTS